MSTGNAGRPVDRRIQKTLAAIDEAFAKLLATTEYRKITVSAIAREANINRKTFYLHYSSVDDVLHHTVEQIVKRVVEEVQQATVADNPGELLPALTSAILREIADSSHLDENLLRNIPTSELIDMISLPLQQRISQSYLEMGATPPEHLDYISACYLGALFSVYETWRRSDREESLDDAVDMVRTFLYELAERRASVPERES